MVAEIYAATVRDFNKSMQQTLRNADIPIMYVNADLWTSKISGLKYLGEVWCSCDSWLPQKWDVAV